jgi:hypothetical protein
MFAGRRFSILAVAASLFISLHPAISPNAFAAACSGTSGTDGSYTLMKFTTAQTGCTWAVPSGVTAVGVLLVGGGGGAGFGSLGGGGGAGQVLVTTGTTQIDVSPADVITITVGASGSGGYNTSQAYWNAGANGETSTVTIGSTTVRAIGGGGGGGNNRSSGNNGGSGGGGASGGTRGTAITNNFSGFTSYGNSATAHSGEGAGGAGAGATGSGKTGGAGVTIWGLSIAGGGGGWSSGSGATSYGAGSGLSGIDSNNHGTPGTNGTGSGGGGGERGGSGLVVFRYMVDSIAPTFTSASTASIQENSATSTNITTVSVSESATILISAGLDMSQFSVVRNDSTTAFIRFASSPDYEYPLDSGGNNVYNITVSATDRVGNVATQAITITVTNMNESSSISAPSLSIISYKGQTETITVTVNVAGKVRFFVGGKRISTCLAKSTTGTYPSFTATCYWKPPVTGHQSITASLTPTDYSFSSSTSNTSMTQVVKRSTTR